jgi:hypothetical protein
LHLSPPFVGFDGRSEDFAGRVEFGTGGKIVLRNRWESTDSLRMSSISVSSPATAMLMDWTASRMHSTWTSLASPVADFRT